MEQLIWYSAQTGQYTFGSEMDLKVAESLTGEEMEVLYEMTDAEMPIIKKIVNQLNTARVESSLTNSYT
ncbi:hypothetical protein [Marinoscillum furvescens]|uniref:Uncharacterized protein n=1 Tax=Marinoscillum furvescens DSM 4134 TaxID=1122208 RepID=A0A3D9L5V5_MARFU|nr:hypothetical protein [Marinoscillum furvescens]REE00474.1 hypothetical protein C7460_10597 [Marinoscillum furvescens DSM 4134]